MTVLIEHYFDHPSAVEMDCCFCSEVHRSDSTVAKTECRAGRPIFQWIWKTPPIREVLSGGGVDSKTYLSSPRVPHTKLPRAVVDGAVYSSEPASRGGLGHISIDLMRSPDGEWRVIEMNSREVAVWWTSKLETARLNDARALYALAGRI